MMLKLKQSLHKSQLVRTFLTNPLNSAPASQSSVAAQYGMRQLNLQNSLIQGQNSFFSTQSEVKAPETGFTHIAERVNFRYENSESKKVLSKRDRDNDSPRKYSEILTNIAEYQKRIDKKQSKGMNLSKQIAAEVEENKFQNQQMYEIFISKMDKLYKSHLRFNKKLKDKLRAQTLAGAYSSQPLKEILRSYNDMTTQGFNGELASKTLQNLDRAIRARGFDQRVMMDYTQTELEESWRLQKVIEDLTFGLRPDQFFSPHHMGETANLLAEINYKDSNLITKYFEKIHALVKERQTGQKEHFELTMDHIIFGAQKNYLPRHYVYRGFENSEDFNSHLQILLQWKQSQEGYQTLPKVTNKQSQNQEVAELESAMKGLIEASLEVKEVQKDLQATIDNVRSQYFKMLEASDKYAFLQENEYIRYDLLELQERLVRAGYLTHEEALQHLSNEPFEKRMDRAAKVFYDYVVNFAPEVLSPQHEQFYQAAQQSLQTMGSKKKNVTEYLNEDHNQINLTSLSEILYGLRKQSLLYRKDVQKKDYLNEFYHQFVEPEDKMGLINELFQPHERRLAEKKNVQMERVYLRPWATFRAHTQELLSYMKELAKKDSTSLSNQVRGILAFAAAGFDVPDVRRKLVRRSLNLIQNKELDAATVKGGLLGLALSSTQDAESLQLAAKLAEQAQPHEYDFSEQIDVMWSLCALQQYDAPALKELCKIFENFEFERLAYELKFEEFNKLMDIMNALKLESNGLTINNKSLQDIYTSRKTSKNLFSETQQLFDPFKKRVLSALALGLGKSSISHELIMEDELLHQHIADEYTLNPEKYPYTPDMMMGYKGQKVAMFVLQEFDATRDTYEPNGAQRFRMRLLERANNGELKTASISVNEVVNYDIENMKVKLNDKFNLVKTLETRLESDKQLEELHDFSKLSNFGYSLVKAAVSFQENQPRIDQVQKLDSFVKKLGQIFQLKQQADLKIDPTQRNNGFDQVRFQMMLLSIMYDRLAKETQQFVDSQLPEGQTLKALLLQTAQTIKTQNDKPTEQSELDQSWLGTRLTVELPSFNSESGIQAQKAVEPEMLNQRFLWVESYFHYKDWQAAQEQVYDHFNLLEVPSVSADKVHPKPKYYFDKESFNRRIPEGVFPLASHKREVLKPYHQYAEMDMARSKNNDELALFAKEPLKMMILKELKKSEKLLPVNDKVRMITNLQNIKQGLKADYSDRELLSTILLNLNFTDDLIKEHLSKRDGSYVAQQAPQFLERDPALFREFVRSTYDSKDRQDPYTHFYLQEAAKKQYRVDEYERVQREIDEHEHNMNQWTEENHKKKVEQLQEKIDSVLLEYEMKNEDLYQLSSPLQTRVSIDVNMNTLVKSEFVYDIEPELNDQGLSDQEYLSIQRCRAETKLIKMKILYKMHRDIELSENERKYLKVWVDDVTKNQNRNALNLRDSLVPTEPSRLSLRDMSDKDFYTLNSIPRVDIDRRQDHSKFALNDLVLELNHFLDEDAINKVETQMLSERLRKEWGLSKDFKVVESRNKEISLVLNELEEMAYRAAGEFTNQDLEYIKKMLSVARNKTVFDKSYYDLDMKSLEQFVQNVNPYDDRIILLEKWIRRKEEEIRERVVVAPQNLRKTDGELHQEYDRPLKEAREKIVSKFLATDEYGNPIKKDYKDLSSLELHRISENLAVRLYLFNYDYPAFLPQAVKAVIEHPNLLRSDKDTLVTYCKVFELDWKGDQSVENKSQLLFQTPIYPYGANFKSYGQIDGNAVHDRMRRACAPYVEPLASKVLQSAESL